MKNDTPAVSVIIPVYNVEKYLRRCLDSVVNQTFTDFELILVNDGSTDSSLEICQEYAIADSRIKVIDTPNGGCSKARRLGLDNAIGKWILQIDSDDWMELNMLQRLHETGEKEDADIVACGIFRDSGERIISRERYPYENVETIGEICRIGGIYTSFCNKLIRRRLYDIYNISPIDGISMWEDCVVTTRLRYHSKKTVVIKDTLYHYFVGQHDSICNRNYNEYPTDQIKVINYLTEYFKDTSMSLKLYNKLVNCLKVDSKRIIFNPTTYDSFQRWRGLFPESNKYILFVKSIPIKFRLYMFLASIFNYRVYSVFRKTGKLICKIK